MRIAYQNYVDTASSLTALTEATGYSVINVQDQRLSVAYRSTAVTAQTVTIDLGSAQAIDTIAVMGHNLTSSAIVTVAANSSDSWPGATSQTVTVNSGMSLKYFTPVTYRYWQFQISDPANTSGYIEVGRLWLGDYITIDPSSTLDFTVTKRRADNAVHNEGRQKYASIRVGWREFSLSFSPSDEAMIAQMSELYDAVGMHSSFIFCNFDTIRDYVLVEPCYVSINSEVGFDHSERMRFSYSLDFEEEI
jgi:hypothetical protein